MEFETLFRQFWWLIFPIFGMFIAIWGMIANERRAREAMGVIKSYVDQGKEPPQELVDLAAGGDDYRHSNRHTRGQSGAWSFVTFAALAIGFGAGYYVVKNETYAFAFLIVALVMAVMAIGAFFILLFAPKSTDQ